MTSIQSHRSNSRAGGQKFGEGSVQFYDVIMASEFKHKGSCGFRNYRALGRNHLRALG